MPWESLTTSVPVRIPIFRPALGKWPVSASHIMKRHRFAKGRLLALMAVEQPATDCLARHLCSGARSTFRNAFDRYNC